MFDDQGDADDELSSTELDLLQQREAFLIDAVAQLEQHLSLDVHLALPRTHEHSHAHPQQQHTGPSDKINR